MKTPEDEDIRNEHILKGIQPPQQVVATASYNPTFMVPPMISEPNKHPDL